MKLTGNTILITGGGSGIGRALAEGFAERGNTVIITGRRKDVLDEVTKVNPAIRSYVGDVETADELKKVAAQIVKDFPALNVVINNAGIMQLEDFKSADWLKTAEQTIGINILGTVRTTEALLPALLKQPSATIVTVTSGLAFIPIATNPTYCGTKAFVHSWTQSLRYQLKDTKVEVLELAPPYVQTELMGAQQKTDPNAMPLEEFIREVFTLLEKPPASGEILVDRVKPMRFAERDGKYDELYAQRNEMAVKRAAEHKS